MTIPIFSPESIQIYVVFSLVFPLNSDNHHKGTEADIASLSWVFPVDSEIDLYSRIPIIRETGHTIINVIQKKVADQKIDAQNIDKIGKIVAYEFEDLNSETNLKFLEISEKIDKTQELMLLQADFIDMSDDSELKRAFKSFKDIPKETIIPLMQAAILGEPILFVTDKYSFNSIISILFRFHYRPVFRKVYMTTPKKLYGEYQAIGVLTKTQITKDLIKNISIIYNVYTKKIQFIKKRKTLGVVNTWCSSLLLSDSIEDLLPRFQQYITDKNFYVAMILNSLSYYSEEKKNVSETKALISSLKKNMAKDDFEFVMEIAIKTNPHLEDFIRTGLFASFLKLFR
ncbi:MAG: hypothetical protein ACFE95_11770 [Candidatus Hodarchaeota archaeon]